MEDDFAASQLAKQIQRQVSGKLRKVEYVEHQLPDQMNFRQSGIYQIKVQQKHQISQPSEYCFDPLMLNQILSAPSKPLICGLQNLGASCFMNTALQAMISSPSFLSLFSSAYYQQLMKQNQVATALFKTLNNMRLNHTQPREFANILQIFKMSPHQQSDSSELILKFLDELIEFEAKLNGFEQKPFRERETTAIDQILGSHQVQILRCKSCSQQKQTITKSRSLIVPLNKTLRKSFTQLLQPVEIENYTCDFCQQKVTVEKRVEIADVSRVVLIQIQRWDDFGQKNNKHCRIPECLDLKNGITLESIQHMEEMGKQDDIFTKMSKTTNKFTHRLSSVICHSGVANYGHYYCYAQSQGTWRLFDDDRVSKVDFEHIAAGNEAMFLVYEEIQRVQDVFTQLKAVSNTVSEAVKPQQYIQREVKTVDPQVQKETAEKENKLENKEVKETKQEVKVEQKAEKKQKSELIVNPFTAPMPESVKKSSEIQKECQPGGFLSSKSDLLHTQKSKMDMEIDAPRLRKTGTDRQQNKLNRQQEIRERRYQKSQDWWDRQKRIEEDKRRIEERLKRGRR
ncbi:Ubiquitin_carboxyl-terminal hydrolase family protein [Hexamita inflata]|uniref:Ubiquitin_carboxyl-terminal hydrolase family protein n=1 Tax=Hexamita inflata TaxID=28002 RepID=A0ABP1JXD8_9EUKA